MGGQLERGLVNIENLFQFVAHMVRDSAVRAIIIQVLGITRPPNPSFPPWRVKGMRECSSQLTSLKILYKRGKTVLDECFKR